MAIGFRAVTPAEIIFRTGESLRFLRERSGRVPRVKLARDYLDAPERLMPKALLDVEEDREAVVRICREDFSDSCDESILIADGILNNRIPLFSETIDCGERIDWHLEPHSGKRAPLDFYRDIDTLDSGAIGDAKYIWELNRQNYLMFLGKAYWLSGDEKYFLKWKEIILSWIGDNPYNRGINWESSLELSFRSINWIWSSCFFREKLRQDNDLQQKIFDALYLHAHHIHGHLSYYFSPNTHLTGEALGLLYIGKSYPAMESAATWVSTAGKILERELGKQILGDGGYFEMATYYHKYTVDFYIHYLLLGKGRIPSEGPTASIIGKMVKHLVLLSEPDGTIPLLGDSDGGQLLFFNMRKRNVKGACCTAAVLLRDSGLKHLCGDAFQEEALWLLGSRGREEYGRLDGAQPQHYHSINKDTGYYCFRNGMKESDSFLLIDCGPHGWKACGHAHSDLLSIIWYSRGGSVIVDPGTLTYSGSRKLRDESRSSQGHNTITIDGISQSVPGETFKWKKIAHPRRALARIDESGVLFEGGHDAYLEIGCRHRRIALFLGNDLSVIIDKIGITNPLDSLLYCLHFTDGNLICEHDHVYRFDRRNDATSHYIGCIGTIDFSSAVTEGAYYPDYGTSVTTPRLELREENIGDDHMIATILSPDLQLIDSFAFREKAVLSGGQPPEAYSISTEGAFVEVRRNGGLIFAPNNKD